MGHKQVMQRMKAKSSISLQQYWCTTIEYQNFVSCNQLSTNFGPPNQYVSSNNYGPDIILLDFLDVVVGGGV